MWQHGSEFHSFLGLDNIPVVCIHHIFSTHSSVDGHLVCFQAGVFLTYSHNLRLGDHLKSIPFMALFTTHCDRNCGRYKGESDMVPSFKKLMLPWERRKERSKSNQHLLIAHHAPDNLPNCCMCRPRQRCEADIVIWENGGSQTLSNHLRSGKTRMRTHILDSESCVHSTRHAAPSGARQNVTNPKEKATGRWKGRNDQPPEGAGSWQRSVLEVRKVRVWQGQGSRGNCLSREKGGWQEI